MDRLHYARMCLQNRRPRGSVIMFPVGLEPTTSGVANTVLIHYSFGNTR